MGPPRCKYSLPGSGPVIAARQMAKWSRIALEQVTG